MAYKQDEINNITKEYPLYNNKFVVANINLFKVINNFELNSFNEELIKNVLEIYDDYIRVLYEFPKYINRILKNLKTTEIVDNNTLEHENINLLIEYMETKHSYTVDYLLKKFINVKNPLDVKAILKCHEILMRGTNNSNFKEGFRKDNTAFIKFTDQNNNSYAKFFPISYDEINEAIHLFLKYYNKQIEKDEDVFLIPIISQLLLSSLQVFYDGNTRLARTLTNVKIYELSKDLKNYNINSPVLFYSRQIMPYRSEYRDLIYQFVLNPSNETINNWIKFHLYRIMDQLFYTEDSLTLIRAKEKI